MEREGRVMPQYLAGAVPPGVPVMMNRSSKWNHQISTRWGCPLLRPIVTRSTVRVLVRRVIVVASGGIVYPTIGRGEARRGDRD